MRVRAAAKPSPRFVSMLANITESRGERAPARARRRVTASAAVLAVLAGAGVLAAAPERASGRLVSAFFSGDELEFRRAGYQLGASGLAAEIESNQRARSLAALRAAPHAEDAWTLLAPLAAVARGPDRPKAVASSRSAAAIASELTRAEALRLDIPDALLGEAIEEYREIAADPGRFTDVRVNALETTRALGEATQSRTVGFRVEAVALGDDPEVRRAAFELLPTPLSARHLTLAGERAQDDPDPAVAAAAMQALCGGLALGDDPEPALDALGDGGLSRLRKLLYDPPDGAGSAALIDAALCAAAAGDEESQRALARFGGLLEPRFRDVFESRARAAGLEDPAKVEAEDEAEEQARGRERQDG